jgi:hypothetical protein
MPWTTEAGKSERKGSLFLGIPEGQKRARYSVQIVEAAPDGYKDDRPERRTTDVFDKDGVEWGNLVFGCEQGYFDVARPAEPVGNWKPESINAFWNELAEFSGVCPDATNGGIKKADGKDYASFKSFIRDIVNRGGWIDIELYRNKNDYAEFSGFIGASVKPGKAASKPSNEPEF